MTNPDGRHRSPPAPHGGRRRIIAAVATVALALLGLTLIARAALGQQAPPQPAHTQAAGSSSDSAKSTHPTGHHPLSSATPSNADTPSPYLPASKPTRIAIPAIGVHADIIRLGLKRDGSIQVPPLNQTQSHSQAGWYTKSPTPGQLGPSVILGHIDSAKYGPAVFFKLGALTKGDTVNVTRADHTTARFRIDRVVEYPKNHFPTAAVYGSIDHAGLRLITCGGHFDPAKGHYQNNIVAYATLTTNGDRP